MRRFKTTKNDAGKNSIWVYILHDGYDYVLNTEVTYDSEYTIFSAMDFDMDLSTLEKIPARIGDETLTVYKLKVESLSIGEEYDSCIAEDAYIYLSDLERFIEYPVLGMDYLSQMNIEDTEEQMELEFSVVDMSYEVIAQKRKNYLEYWVEEQIKLELTDFFFIKDGIYPADFELILVIDQQGKLSAGCVDKGHAYRDGYPHGVIRQSRGGVMYFDNILAWKPIDGLKVVEM